jgi:Flp pilus assembly protein TadD
MAGFPCPDEDLARLTSLLGTDESEGLSLLDDLLRRHDQDARLHFLDGSMRAARRDYQGARVAMTHAVDLAPDYAIARFQLGLLLLTEAEPDAARAVLAPLASLGEDDPLRLFATGLDLLISDRLSEAAAWLERGIRINSANPAMNHDMGLMVREIHARLADGEAPPSEAVADEPVQSAAQLLLQQAALRSTKH